MLTTFVLERFLWRVSESLHHERLVLRGGMLLAALGVRRPTADVGMLAVQIDSDVNSATTLVREVLQVTCDDGVEFDLANIRSNAIRDDAIYSGVRIVVPARGDRARHPLRIDLNARHTHCTHSRLYLGSPTYAARLNTHLSLLAFMPFRVQHNTLRLPALRSGSSGPSASTSALAGFTWRADNRLS